MVWGGISLRGKTNLVIIEGNLNALRYRDEILDPVAIPYLRNLGPNAILQDDNARPHRARIITEYLQNLGVERMEWPAMSPDLNPIEHLWDQLGRAVYARVTHRTTLADLKQMLVEEWDAIPRQNVAELVSASHMFSSVAHFTNAGSLHAVPHCKGDKSMIKIVVIRYQSVLSKGSNQYQSIPINIIHLPFWQNKMERKPHV